MPGLRGNLCWGNRGSFTIYGEYPSTGMETPDIPYVSTSAYYGHHRLPTGPSPLDSPPAQEQNPQEDMEVSEPSWDTPTRKRLLNDQPPHVFKRIRQGELRNKEEEDLLFMERYLKQTHGCDYYSYKSNCSRDSEDPPSPPLQNQMPLKCRLLIGTDCA